MIERKAACCTHRAECTAVCTDGMSRQRMSLYTLLLQLQRATLHLLPVTAAVLHYCYHCCCIAYKLLCDGVVAVVLYSGLSSRHNVLALDSVLADVAIEADL
eukprot:10820-Heterococcus_DN1.PRE.1